MSMWTEEKLDRMLTAPTRPLIESMGQIKGDIMILGAGGKMGPTLAILAAQARQASRTPGRIIAVSRFSDPIAAELLRSGGVEIIPADLLADGALDALPDAPNIIYMAGRKFGTAGGEAETWALNASLPTLVSRRFTDANIVVFSTGNIYPPARLAAGGCTEETLPEPVGEYAGLGGRATTSLIVSKEVHPLCHPLGAENKLVIAPGMLSGRGGEPPC